MSRIDVECDTKALLDEMQFEISDNVDEITHADNTTFICKLCGHHHDSKFGYKIHKYRTKQYRGCDGCDTIAHQKQKQTELDKLLQPGGLIDTYHDLVKINNATYSPDDDAVICVDAICVTCGHQFQTTLDTIATYHKLSAGTHVGCHKCAERIKRSQSTVDTIQQRAIDKEFTINSPVSTWSFPIELQCNICGNRTITDPKRMFGGNKPRICQGCNIARLNAESREKFKQRILGRNVEIIEYNGYAQNGLFRCTIDDHVWKTTPKKIVETLTNSGNTITGCAECYRKRHSKTS